MPRSTATTRRTRSPKRLTRTGSVVGVTAALAAGLLAEPAGANAENAATPTASLFNFSAVGWTGQNTVIAATDNAGDLYYYAKPSGSSKWVTQLVSAAGTQAFSQPAIAWTGQGLMIVAVDQFGNLVDFTAPAGSPTWTEQTIASTGRLFAFQAPSLTVAANGSVLVSSATTNRDLESFTLAPHGTTWTERLVAGGPFIDSSITTTQGLGIVTAADGGTLYMWWEALVSPGWHKEIVASGDPSHYYVGGSVTASASNIWISANNSYNVHSILAWTQPVNGTGWTESAVSTSGLYSDPQMTWTGATPTQPKGFEVITATTTNGSLSYWWSYDGAATWNPETVAGATSTSSYAQPLITATATSVDVSALGAVSGGTIQIDIWYQPFGTNPWNRQTVATS